MYFSLFKSFLLVLLFTLSISSCSSDATKSKKNIKPDRHTSQNSIDWTGTYGGTLACADCIGIKTKLRLLSDQTYSLSQLYLEGGSNIFTEKGQFKWSEDGSSIELLSTQSNQQNRKFKVGENTLYLLDQDGKIIQGDLSSFYRLSKLNESQLLETTWTLKYASDSTLVAALIKGLWFQIDLVQNTFYGYSGCNSFNAQIMRTSDTSIQLKPIISTRMACPDMEIEAAFLDLFQHSFHYQITQWGELHLLDKEGEVLAKFF